MTKPRPSFISVIMERDTMSRGASSILPGAYFFMNRSPSLFSRYPPSPRAPSVISMPDGIIPVGWNCTNSMSLRARPARYAMSRPSGVEDSAYVEKL